MRTKEQMQYALNTHAANIAAAAADLGGGPWDLQVSHFGALLVSREHPRLAILPMGLMASTHPADSKRPLPTHEQIVSPAAERGFQLLRSAMRSLDAVLEAALERQVPLTSLLDSRWSAAPDGSMRYAPVAAPRPQAAEMEMRM